MRSAVWLLLLMLVPAAGSAGVPLQARNDSGQGRCYDAAGTVQACATPAYRGADGHHGRDAAAADGVLVKAGGGDGGFDYTKIANNGSAVPAVTGLGTAPASWACTRDNHTGLLWEIKVSNAASPRHYEWGFHWYQPDPEHDGGNPGEPGGVELGCGFTLTCNTQAYVGYVNAQALCGRTDWRLPSLDELQDLADFGRSVFDDGALDPVYFADGGPFRGFNGGWTADTGHEPSPEFAYGINFADGTASTFPKGGLTGIRLVSGAQVESEGEPPVCTGIENPQIRPGTAGAYEPDGATVLDRRTGLVWDRCSLGQTFIEEAEGRCEGETWKGDWQAAFLEVRARNAEGHLGHRDWRLPNLKELASLRERRCAMPILDARIFPDPDIEVHWSSTTNQNDPSGAFGMNFEFGHQLGLPKSFDSARLRLVRGGGAFDDHQSTLGYEIAGRVEGLLGTGLVLRLTTDGGGAEALTIGADGRFAFARGVFAGESYTVSVGAAPVPDQSCTVASGSGTVGAADVDDVRVSCAAPAPPVIRVEPPDLDFHVQQSGSQTQSLAIANDGGGILSWSIDTAYEALPAAGRGAPADCQSGSGLIIHDDGSAESAYGGNAAWSGGVMIVDRFTPSSYPASIGSACFAFGGTGGVTSLAFEIVVFDDNGPGGAPGTELGALAVTATGIPPYPVASPVWQAFDLSALYTTIDAGSLYVGLRWQPAQPQSVYVLADESADRPIGHAGGYYWNYSGAGDWRPIQNPFGQYRAMLIRAIEAGPQAPPAGCESPAAVPWLTITPAAGTVDAGTEREIAIGINSTGLEPGDYRALLCVHSDDGGGNTPVRVNVHLVVEPGDGALTLDPPAIAFGAVGLGDSGVGTATLRNTGTGTVQGIDVGAVAAPFARGGGTCPAGPFNLSAGTSCTLGYVFTPTAFGPASATVTIGSSAGTLELGLSGSGAAGAPAVIAALGGGGQSTAVGHPFALPLAVQVRDAANHPVSGATVIFTAPGSGAGAILSATSVTTDGNGYAAVTATANAVTGSYAVQAAVSGVPAPATFALGNTLGGGDVGVRLQAGRDHVRPGQLIDYVLTVFNASAAPATSIEVGSALDAALDAAATHWICLDALASGCTAAGQGALADDGLRLAPGASVSYLLTSPVRLDTVERIVASTALVDAPDDPNPANDTDAATTTMVLFRDGLERYGDGASGEDAEQAVAWPAGQAAVLDLLSAAPAWQIAAPLRVFAGDRLAARIESFRSGAVERLRLVALDGGVERAGPWIAAIAPVRLALEPMDAGAVLRLQAGDRASELTLTASPAPWRLRHAGALGVRFAPSAP
ncbi:MAG TPA: DUF1566 domain-containing protein [Dokdonella sp.]|uniref:Lcl domain-containing protein n=1 Tax=Dokdonella sp. TaxID=2291710 RepID=UPI002C3672DF|nr:DUF1566 domain-containing protein [Dokdonella sp.]HUD41985.1 DUF1566 domain-containing protein [Dokdonella sp.]